jgi:hypothetical protein
VGTSHSLSASIPESAIAEEGEADMRNSLRMVLVATAAVSIAGCSSGQLNDHASGPTASATGKGATSVSRPPARTVKLYCPGLARSTEILPAAGGASTPEREVNAFVSGSVLGLPKQGYLPAPATGTTSSGEPPHRVFVHPSGGGHIDVRLTLLNVGKGWRVDSVQACA